MKEIDLGKLGIPVEPQEKPKIEVFKGKPDFRRKDIDWERNIALYIPSDFPQIRKIRGVFTELESVFQRRSDEVRTIVSLIKKLRRLGNYEFPIELFVDDVRLIIAMDEIKVEDHKKKYQK